MTTFLIIGAGQAAHAALQELERLSFPGKVILVGEESHPPYERPPLSKEVLLNDQAQIDSLLFQTPEEQYKLDLESHLATQATKLNPIEKTAELSDGTVVPFDKCLIATGSYPRQISHLTTTSPAIHYLRTWDDAIRFKKTLNPACSLGIIGAGFLGLELASSAQKIGSAVKIFERSERLLPKHAPPQLSDWLIKQALINQVELHTQSDPLEASLTEDGIKIVRNNTEIFHVDQLAITIGSVAADQLAEAASIPIHPQLRGILVDEHGQTQTPDIYAAGDCATRINADGQPVRNESWQNANELGRRAASQMLGVPSSPLALPWFWTDIFSSNIQMYGQYDASLRYITRNETDSPLTKRIIIGIKNNIIQHAIGINAARELRPLRTLIEKQTTINPEQFLNLMVSLRDFSKNPSLKPTEIQN